MQVTIPKVAGLYVQPNSLNVPEGSLEQADNITINRDNIITKRRGFGAFYTPSVGVTITNIFDYLGSLFTINTNSVKSLTSLGAVDDTYSGQTISVTAGTISKVAKANKNCFFTTNNGVKKVESLTDTTIYQAGIPSALDLTGSYSGTNGILIPHVQYSYRVVFGRKDNNNNTILGAPSALFTIANQMIRNKTAAASGGGSTTITVTSASHGLSANSIIKVMNSNATTAANVDGELIFVASVLDANNFTFTATGSGAGISKLDYGIYRNMSLEATIPPDLYNLDVTTFEKYFYQVYRTKEVDSTAVSATSDVYTTEENLQLVQEIKLTSTDRTNKYFTYVDSIDELFLGADLYTNPNSGEGILQKNDRPPQSVQDIAFFKNHLFYANVETDHTLIIDLITTNISVINYNDTITITQGATTKTYTAKAVENISSREFLLQAPSAAPSTAVSASQAVEITAKSLAKVINRDATGLIDAFYLSSFTDPPGKMAWISRDRDTAFSVTANTTTVGTAFSPALPSSGATVISTNNAFTNGLYISKRDEPEAVPSVNYIFAGDRSVTILRIAALKDSLIVITDAGVWRVNGDSTSNFSSTLIDSTVPCVAKESVAVLNNQVYYLSTQGVVAISDTSAQIVSRQIEPLLSAVLGKSYLSAQTRALAYESEHLYLLSTVSPNEVTADTVYCYNAINQSWFEWDTVFAHGLVKQSDDKLYYVSSLNVLKQERKNQNKLDYTDQSYSLIINSVPSTNTATMAITGAAAAIGDVVVIDSIINRISDIDNSSGTIVYTFLQPVNFVASDIGLLYKGFTSAIKTSPQHGGDISRFKQYSEFSLSLRNQSVNRITLSFSNDSAAGSSAIEWINPLVVSGWGSAPWGGFGWGQQEGIANVYTTQAAPIVRTYVPLETSRGTYIQAIISHDSAAEDLSIQSLSYTVRAYGQRISK